MTLTLCYDRTREQPPVLGNGPTRRPCFCWRDWRCTKTTGTKSVNMLAVEPRTSVSFTSSACPLRTHSWRRVTSAMQVSQVIKSCIVQSDYLNFIFNEQYTYYDKQVGFFFLISKMNRGQMYNSFYIMVITCILQDPWRTNPSPSPRQETPSCPLWHSWPLSLIQESPVQQLNQLWVRIAIVRLQKNDFL